MHRRRPQSRKSFEHLVRKALLGLPARFRRRLENVAVMIEDEPPEGVPPDTLGLYEGVPLTQRCLGEPTLPDRIVLFRGPLERACHTPQEVEAEVRRTVLHEVGHFFGLEEEELE